MAIAFDAATALTAVGSVTSTSYTHTTSGSDRFLVVGVGTEVANSVTSVTYNSVAMTASPDSPVTPPSGGYHVYLFYLDNPASGSNTVAITIDNTGSIYSKSASYTGKTTSGIDAHNSNNGTGTTGTVAVTTVADNCWVIGVWRNEGAGNPSAGTNTTLRDAASSFNSIAQIGDTNAAQTPAGSHSIEATVGSSQAWAWVAISIAPTAASGSSTAHNFGTLGVGT